MAKTASLMLQGDVLTVQPYRGEPGRDPGAGRAFVLEVVDEAACGTLLASLPLLDRLLAEKVAAVRERRMEEMVDFMATKVPTLEPALVQALADAARTDVKNIERMHELQAQRELEQLLEAKPEILLTFKGFGNNGYEKSIVDLPKVAQHQLGVKVVESLNKARDQVFSRVMRTRRIADLGSVPLIEDAAKQVKEWVTLFEEQHKDELNEAIEAGRSIRTLDDIEEP